MVASTWGSLVRLAAVQSPSITIIMALGRIDVGALTNDGRPGATTTCRWSLVEGLPASGAPAWDGRRTPTAELMLRAHRQRVLIRTHVQ